MHSETEQKRPAARRRWRWLLEVALVAGVLFALHSYQTRNVADGTAPAFQARLLDGTRVSLDDYRGKPLLLQFWATWCPVCRLEQGGIDAIARDRPVLAVSLDEMNAEDLQAWMAGQGVSYPVAIDNSGELARLYGITGVPASFVIDGNGEIRFTEVGFTSETGLRLRLWWAGR
jgi:peroxiredoxin